MGVGAIAGACFVLKFCGGSRIQKEPGVGMALEETGRAFGADWAIAGCSHGRRFAWTRHHDAELPRGEEYGQSQSQGVGRYRFEVWETAVVDLLLTAHSIEFHGFDPGRVVKIRDRWIVECQMPVLADAEANQVNRSGL